MKKDSVMTAKMVAWAYAKLKNRINSLCEGHAPTVVLLALIEVFFDYAANHGLDAASAFTEALAARKVREASVLPKPEEPKLVTL